jgi:Protein of unknown function (DUF1579)
MKILTVVGFVLMVAQASVGLGETPSQQPKPGAEIQKLAYYLGTWEGAGEAKDGPFGPGGKLSSTTTCEWFAGGFHLVCRGEEHGPTGKRTFLNIRGYDEKTKGYTEYSVSDLGESEYNTGGTIVGNKRTFTFAIDAGGKPTQLRYVEVQVSPTLFTYQAAASTDGGPWTVIAEGKVKKVK